MNSTSDHLFDANVPDDILERARRVKVLVMDVDGVLTDGKITYGESCGEIKSFHVLDGLAIRILQRFGIVTAIISGRKSEVVINRARELDIEDVHVGSLDKEPALRQVAARHGVEFDAMACVGDDLPDLPLLKRCGLACAPANAHPFVRSRAHHVTRANGGHGVIREIAELILHSQNKLESYLELFDR